MFPPWHMYFVAQNVCSIRIKYLRQKKSHIHLRLVKFCLSSDNNTHDKKVFQKRRKMEKSYLKGTNETVPEI